MTPTLCEGCTKLELSADRFTIRNDTRPSLRSLRSGAVRLFVGTLKHIKESSASCSLCDTLLAALPPDALEDLSLDEVNCHLVWELDGRESSEPWSSKRSRRLRIHWDLERLRSYEAYLVLVAPSAYKNSDLDYSHLLNEETQFLGRRIGSAVNKRNLIREFLRLCEENHDDRCTARLGIEDPFAETLEQPYFGVIDIQNERLVPLRSYRKKRHLVFDPYATVSYVWGDNRKHSTTLANIQDRRKSGGLAQTISELPLALKQSIDLVSNLGIRYIWIDSLCIIQDSSHSWNLNARAMHLIYGNSTLTICAANGPSSDTALLPTDESHQHQQKIAEYAPGVHLMLHQAPESAIENSKWNQRAWTFQERLLSKRCVIFTGGQLYFQCRSTGMSEDIFANKDGKGWSLDLTGSPLQTLTQLKRRALWFYTNCVDLYTRRSLFQPFDILAAFSGMCKLMEGTLKAPFIFGMPTSHFDFALLWQPVGVSVLLKEPDSNDEKYKGMRFPSWSWCGWRNEGESKGIRYKHEMVEGCLADVRAWLKSHTWIDWHIRDGYGTPQRIWDSSWAEEDQSSDFKWRGYCKEWTGDKEPSQADSEVSGSEVDSEVTGSEVDGSVYAERERPVYRTRARREKNNTLAARLRRAESAAFEASELRRQRGYDAFGRLLRPPASSSKEAGPIQFEFRSTLPEYPFHVPKASFASRSGGHREFPDLPILQFFTWATELYIVATGSSLDDDRKEENGESLGGGEPKEEEEKSLPDGVPSETETKANANKATLQQCHIIDQRSDKCGSIMIDSTWLREHHSTIKFEFIAISEAKSFTQEEMPDWSYYIPKERIESEWDVYFVLLIEHYPQEGLSRRVALGKVFKAAFTHNPDDEWKEIVLG